MGDSVNCSKLGGEILKKKIIVVASVVLVLGTLVAIWLFSAQNASDSSALSGSLAEFVAHNPWISTWIDTGALEAILRKLAHGFVYFVLGMGLTGMLTLQSPRQIPAVVIAAGAIFAALDEFHQCFVPGRGPSVYDVMIDTVGVSLGMLLILLCRRGYRKYLHKS